MWLPMLVPLGCSPEAPEPEPEPAPLTVMSFNVLCSFCDASYDRWTDRLVAFDDIFARHQPQLVGTQELATPAEVEDIRALLPGFDVVFWGEAEAQGLAWPDAAVFYDADRFTLVDHGFYWLSPTPDDPLSIGFSSPQLPRLVTWAHLDDGGSDLFFATTHFDNNSPSQDLSAPLLVERTTPWADEMPVIVTGDFNSQPYDPAFATLTVALQDTYALAADPVVVHHQPAEPAWDDNERIDHVFVAGADWTVTGWAVDLSVYDPGGGYPSDHWPVVAELLR